MIPKWFGQILVVITVVGSAFAQHEQAFIFSGANGQEPQGGLTADSLGNLYGTTFGGGSSDGGTVFEMSRSANGVWTETILFSFTDGNAGALLPVGSPILDSAGNLYGVTTFDCGAVYELSPPSQSGGQWTETTLWSFSGGADGCVPQGLTNDQAGNLYGTNSGGNTGFDGVAFELFKGQGGFQFQIIYSFQGQQDGAFPMAAPTIDAQGNLYGSTAGETVFGHGTVFMLTPPAQKGQQWTETTLHTFGVAGDGYDPMAALVLGPRGTLIGTTAGGGEFVSQAGTIFALSPPPNPGGEWGYKLLYSFGGTPNDGALPYSSLTLQSPTVAYGTTSSGGSSNAGTVYQFTQTGANSWAETPVYNFTSGNDGGVPTGGVLLQNFALYGTTSVGGVRYKNCPSGCGVAFQLSH